MRTIVKVKILDEHENVKMTVYLGNIQCIPNIGDMFTIENKETREFYAGKVLSREFSVVSHSAKPSPLSNTFYADEHTNYEITIKILWN